MHLLKSLTIFSFVTTGLAAAISGLDAHGNLDLYPRAACVGPNGCQQKVRIFSFNLLNRNRLTWLNSAGVKVGKMVFSLTWCRSHINFTASKTRTDWKYVGTANALMTRDMDIGLVMAPWGSWIYYRGSKWELQDGNMERGRDVLN